MNKRRVLLRVYEIVLCLIILCIVFIPLCVFVVVKLAADGWPLFYNSKRIGVGRKAFTVYKFRSMVNNRAIIEEYLSSIRSYGFEKIPLDAIVYTKMGRLFERFQIVEFLQIFNVLQGHMSLIGYRPLPIKRVLQLEEELDVESLRLRHSVKPGITGISQIIGKASLSNRERVELENKYNFLVQSQPELKVLIINSLIIFETVAQIFLKRHFFMKYLNREMHKCAKLHPAPSIAEEYPSKQKEQEEFVPSYFRRARQTSLSKSRSRIAS